MNAISLSALLKLAKFAGGRFDLVQAGGGNVSFKDAEDYLWIKISGISMSDMESTEQCAQVINSKVGAILAEQKIFQEKDKKTREDMAQQYLLEANLTPHKKPSIETFLHAMLFDYTLHVHPITVNHLVIRKDAKKIIAQIFPESLFLDYATPGIDLAIQLKMAVTEYEKNNARLPYVVFLKNHGLLVSHNEADQVKKLTQDVIKKIENYLQIDYSYYHVCNEIADLFNVLCGAGHIALLCEDYQILNIWKEKPHLLFAKPTSPDVFVFNGYEPCNLTQLTTLDLQNYFLQYACYPRVVIYQNYLFFINRNMRKAKEMQDVFKFHLMALWQAQGEIDYLSRDELRYLLDWEAEKYRQK